MHRRWKWLSMAFVSLWLLGCSQGPRPVTKVLEPAAPTSAQASATQGLPVAEVPEREFDFGAMKEDDTYVHDFRILNKGTGILEIKSVRPAGGTTIVRFDRTIPPGGEGTVKISLNPKSCQKSTKKVSYAKTNDGGNSMIPLTVTGHLAGSQ